MEKSLNFIAQSLYEPCIHIYNISIPNYLNGISNWLLKLLLSSTIHIMANPIHILIQAHANLVGPSLSFDVDNKPAFEIPLKDVSQATTGKYSQARGGEIPIIPLCAN